MAITSVGNPQTLTPGYNPSVWYFNSTNKALPGFRYYVEIWNAAATTLLGTYRFVPAITTGYAVVDVTKIMKSFLSADDSTSGIQLTPNSWTGYVIKVYDEYNTSFTYSNFVNPSGDLTALYHASNTHTFQPGDQINVSQTDGGALNPALQGIQTVIAPTVSGTGYVYVDVSWATLASGTMGGTVIYADNRKTISAVQLTTSAHYLFNGSVPHNEWPLWLDTDYKMTGASGTTKFLTSMPRKFWITETQDIRLSFANYFTNDNKLWFENDGGDLFQITTATVITGQAVIAANVGPQTTLTLLTGSAPLIKPTTEYYDVYVMFGATQVSEKIRFYIDRRCKIQDFEIAFMDRMGSMVSFAFQLRGDVTNTNDKSTYKRMPGYLGTDASTNHAYTYLKVARGETVYNVNFNQTQSLNTNWMNDESSLYFQELITSPFTYLKIAANTYVPIVITTSSMVEKRQVDKRLIRYTIDVRFGNNQVINI